MKKIDFVNLHVHTEYSLLDGASRIKNYIARAKELGQSAAAITDHGNMYGVIEFYNEAKQQGIKPIIGCEVYVARRTRFDREPKLDSSPYHLILLCENNIGYKNLVKLVSIANLEGFYNKPRVDTELLERYSDGLICLSACLAGEIPRKLENMDYSGAVESALKYQKIFGRNNFFIEVQNHGIRNELKILHNLYRLSEELNIPLAATNDCHYISKSDSAMQKVLLCIQMNKTLSEPNPMAFETDEFYVKSVDEMSDLFPDKPQAILNTVKIAERCNVNFEFGNIKLPKFTIDSVNDNNLFFRKMCIDGMHRIYGENPNEIIIGRMKYELEIISKMGYTDYFLIVWDFINYAKKSNIPVGPGRGSGAGSLCAYCIGITGIDPIKYNLLFERFLNPERVSMPDFDIDFCIEGRQKVKDYVVKKYGTDYVSEIIAFDTLKARAAIRDVGRVMGISYQICDRVAKQIEFGRNLDEATESSDELKSMYNSDKSVKELIDMSKQLEGMPRHASTHAAGVVISAVPISDLVPLQKNDDTVVTQYTMGVLESLGLLKMDFLGLRNLTVIRDCVNLIKQRNSDFSVDKIRTDDAEVYKMLSKGDAMGVFQFESDGMRQKLIELQPEKIEDLIAVLSLYRPGPMKSIPTYIENKHNPQNIKYKHELLRGILSETYGCIVYQEQVMEIFRKLAGYSYGRADIVRRAMAKKKHGVMLRERAGFIDGAKKNGVTEKIASEIFDEMVGFASYAFNKSHAAAYSYLAYQTAYLKCHYFNEYMSALLSSVMMSSAKLLEYIGECRSKGVTVTNPDVNKSLSGFTYADGKIYFGLLAIKNCGRGLADKIVSERKINGEYKNINDFISRIECRDLNKRAFENMIKAGAFDSLDLNRRQLMDNYEELLSSNSSDNGINIDGQMNLLDAADSPCYNRKISYAAEFPENILLNMEKEATGMYLSGNPLEAYVYFKQLVRAMNIFEFVNKEKSDNEIVAFICTVQSVKPHISKNGSKMAFITVADESGEVDAVIFPDLFGVVASRIKKDAIIFIKGKLSYKDESVSVVCDSIISDYEIQDAVNSMKLCIKLKSDEKLKINDIMKLSEKNLGETELVLYFEDYKKFVVPKNKIKVNVSKAYYNELVKNVSEQKVGLIN